MVLLDSGDALVGLYIRGLTDAMMILGIREDPEGRPVSCAVTNAIYIDTAKRLDLLSGPRRPNADTGEY